jgi:hypothetical protein
VPAIVTFVNQSVPACHPDWPYYRYFYEHPHRKQLQIVTVTTTTLSNGPADLMLLVIHPALLPHGDGLHIAAQFGDRVGLGWNLVKTSPACTG